MRIFADFAELAEAVQGRRTVATIGVFDGMHRGHQMLIGRLNRAARVRSYDALVISFSNHPLSVLAPPYNPKRLLYLDRKHQILERLGVDLLAEIPFTERFSTWTPEAFIDQVLVRQCHISGFVCGYDFSFGKSGAGNAALLQQLGRDYGFDVEVVDKVSEQDVLVKSTHIRDLLFNGEIAKARQLLTRPHELRGTVVSGFQRGRTIGFPTANLDVGNDHVVPAIGVYFCLARQHRKSAGAPVFGAMVNIGTNPTFGLDRISIEAHLLDFDGDLGGEVLELHFLERLRDECKFPDVDGLVKQLRYDEGKAREIYGSSETQEAMTQLL